MILVRRPYDLGDKVSIENITGASPICPAIWQVQGECNQEDLCS